MSEPSLTLVAASEGGASSVLPPPEPVVTPAQALMVIVPRDDALEVEAFLKNKDIGFVNAGQQAEVKIETFPFTKYGTIPASLTHVSHDAINDEKRGLIYSTRARLQRATVQVEDKTVNHDLHSIINSSPLSCFQVFCQLEVV